jgi:hypothetical protein
MSRIFKFVLLSVLILFSFSCGLILSNDWNGIPIVPQATGGQETKEKDGYTYKTNENMGDVLAFYMDKLNALGWTPVVEPVVGKFSDLLIVKKGASSLEINIFDRSPNGAAVIIYLHMAPAP